jgi:hypothetical protein
MKLDLNFTIRTSEKLVSELLADNLMAFDKSLNPLKMLEIARKLEANPVIELGAEDLQKLEQEVKLHPIATLLRGSILEAIVKAKK